jgi:hypothetical protein
MLMALLRPAAFRPFHRFRAMSIRVVTVFGLP